MIDLEQYAWGLFLCDAIENNQSPGKEKVTIQEWKTLFSVVQAVYLQEATENPLHTIQLIYFKVSGKYYAEATVTVGCPPCYVGKFVAKMLANGHWPGLTKAPWHHFDVLIHTLPENINLSADHPNYVVPVFLRNERIMDIAY